MKFCAYCGRENEDNAARCRECGTDEFIATTRVAVTPPPRARMKASTRYGLLLPLYVALIVVELVKKRPVMACLWGALAILSFITLIHERRPLLNLPLRIVLGVVTYISCTLGGALLGNLVSGGMRDPWPIVCMVLGAAFGAFAAWRDKSLNPRHRT